MNSTYDTSSAPEVLIAGAGIIGLSLALELCRRGAGVAVLEPGRAMQQASSAAAGMLAVDDPHHPAALRPLARYSGSIYADYLAEVAALSGSAVPFQTTTAIEYDAEGRTTTLDEWSIDPMQLSEALPAAARSLGVTLLEQVGRWDVEEDARGTTVTTQSGLTLRPRALIHASGAWFQSQPIVSPRKGQIFRAQLPPELPLTQVHRRADIYVVPRTQGPRAGTAVIGATVEDAGFDATVHEQVIAALRLRAAELFLVLADASRAPIVDAWSGFRPATRDELPLMGALRGTSSQYIATGHFRNGILLAPGTAVAMADLLEGRTPAVDLSPFAPERFFQSAK
jgi:glycine oxidase